MKRESMHLTLLTLSAALVVSVLAPLDAPAQGSAADPFTRDGVMQPDQTPEIEGVNGPVVAVAASGSIARVSATRTGRRNDPDDVEIAVVEHAGGVTICAIYPSSLLRRNECRPGSEGRVSARNNDVRVAFEVQVPPSVALTARTTNGGIRLQNGG
ncbi:MAG: hypothetical protein WD766_12980 [Gemmatimonadota bacterium]